LPVPGIPLLADASLAGHQLPALVNRRRPGRNVVLQAAAARAGFTVDGVPAVRRAGAEDYWAEVDQLTGRSDLVLASGGA
jgi:hypothetical protein